MITIVDTGIKRDIETNVPESKLRYEPMYISTTSIGMEPRILRGRMIR